MKTLKRKRLAILLEIERLNEQRCERCNNSSDDAGRCDCEVASRIRELGEMLIDATKPRTENTNYRESENAVVTTYDEVGRVELNERHYRRAKRHGVSRIRLQRRYNEENWELEDAITRPVRKHGSKLESEWIEVAKQNGISYTLFRQRVKDYLPKWSHEKAATTPIITSMEASKMGLARNSNYTPEERQRIHENGLTTMLVNQRIKSGNFTKEQAINTKKLSQKDVWARRKKDEHKRETVANN